MGAEAARLPSGLQAAAEHERIAISFAESMPWSTHASNETCEASKWLSSAHQGRALNIHSPPVVGQHLDAWVCKEGAQRAAQARHMFAQLCRSSIAVSPTP